MRGRSTTCSRTPATFCSTRATPRGRSAPTSTAIPLQGDPYATFLLGIVSGSSNYPLYPWWRQPYTALFVNDDWKVSRRLTLNLGLRYDITPFAHEKWNRQNGPFDPNASSGITIPAGALAALRANGVPESQVTNIANLKGSITFAGKNGVGNTPATLKKKNIGPRFGFAYQLERQARDARRLRAVLSAIRTTTSSRPPATAPAPISSTRWIAAVRRSPTSSATPIRPASACRPGPAPGAVTFAGKNNNWFDAGAVIPKVWSFSYGFQYQVSRGFYPGSVLCGQPQLRPDHAEGLQHPEPGFPQDMQHLRRRKPDLLQPDRAQPVPGCAGLPRDQLLHLDDD